NTFTRNFQSTTAGITTHSGSHHHQIHPRHVTVATSGYMVDNCAGSKVTMEFFVGHSKQFSDPHISVARTTTQGSPRTPGPSTRDGSPDDLQDISFVSILGSDAEGTISSGSVVFDKVLTNKGNGYDPTIGLFQAQRDGVYVCTGRDRMIEILILSRPASCLSLS
ncbi:hypothetical protein C0Q70_05097, partial [Pomacea canaliculata]